MSEVLELAKELIAYTRHDERCASKFLDTSPGYTKRPVRSQACDCGLDEVLERLKAEAE